MSQAAGLRDSSAIESQLSASGGMFLESARTLDPSDNSQLNSAHARFRTLPETDQALIARALAADPSTALHGFGIQVLIEQGKEDIAARYMADSIGAGSTLDSMAFGLMHRDLMPALTRVTFKTLRMLASDFDAMSGRQRARAEQALRDALRIPIETPLSTSVALEALKRLEYVSDSAHDTR